MSGRPSFDPPEDDELDHHEEDELDPGPGIYAYDVLAEHHPEPDRDEPYVEISTGMISVVDGDGDEYQIELDARDRLSITHRQLRSSRRMYVLPDVTNRITIDTQESST